jgi:hypothetical protein
MIKAPIPAQRVAVKRSAARFSRSGLFGITPTPQVELDHVGCPCRSGNWRKPSSIKPSSIGGAAHIRPHSKASSPSASPPTKPRRARRCARPFAQLQEIEAIVIKSPALGFTGRGESAPLGREGKEARGYQTRPTFTSSVRGRAFGRPHARHRRRTTPPAVVPHAAGTARNGSDES